jgi:hypothetical protein
MYTQTQQERHHKVIRRHTKDRQNTTNLEKGLSEDLVAHSLRDLQSQPLRSGFIDAHPASAPMMRTLKNALQCSGNDVTTTVSARSGPAKFHRGDVAMYTTPDGANDVQAGDIVFFAGSREWGECAFVTAWARLGGSTNDAFWRFQISDDLVRVPVEHLMCTCTAFIGDSKAQVVCPPIVFCM